ncbi:MAG: YqeG family HAD IIIA-type phosphatase, partial [Clostridia bacterium]
MHRFLIPDGMYQNIYKVTPALLFKKNKRGIIFDIDNTVAPYEIEKPTEKMKTYFSILSENNLKIAFVSNNSGGRAEIFNSDLGFFCVSDAGKPSPLGILKCLDHFSLSADEVVLVGDQIFTDCLAAHRAGVECFLVKPIKDKETWFFKIKRLFEKPYINEYRKQKKMRRASK